MNINEQLLDALMGYENIVRIVLNGLKRDYEERGLMIRKEFHDELSAALGVACEAVYAAKAIAAAEQAQQEVPRCACGDGFTADAMCANCIADAEPVQQAEPATHSPIALQSIPKRQRDFTAENIRDIAHECMRIGDNEQAAVVFAIADALRDGNLTIHPAAVAVRIRELEAQLNAAILARQEAQQIAQEAIEARNRAGVEIRRPLLKRIRELQAQHGELVSWMTHIQGAALDMSTPRQAIHLATVNAIAAAAQAQAEPVAWKHDCAALLMNDVELWVRNCPHCGKPRAAQPPAVADLQAKPEEAEHHRDCLARAIRNAAVKAGIIHADAAVEGPQLLMLADNLGEAAAVSVPEGLETALMQARYVLRDFGNKQPGCGFDKLATACEQAASILVAQKGGA